MLITSFATGKSSEEKTPIVQTTWLQALINRSIAGLRKTQADLDCHYQSFSLILFSVIHHGKLSLRMMPEHCIFSIPSTRGRIGGHRAFGGNKGSNPNDYQ